MSICQNCSCEMGANAKFCPECGKATSIGEKNKRIQEFAGKIVKCPYCGEVLDSFSYRCPSCGYEVRGAGSVSSVKELENEIRIINSKRKKHKNDNLSTQFVRAFGGNVTDPIDQQLANCICNFSIPNTQEDIIEFMILAVSNIDPSAYSTINDQPVGTSEREGKILISNAWNSKYIQASQKAKIMLPNDSRVAQIENEYNKKQQNIKQQKSKIKVLLSVMFIIIFLLIAIPLGCYGVYEIKVNKLEKQLNETMAEIILDINDGRYDEALIKANGLRFDIAGEKNKEEKWDIQREYLIELINEKKMEDK